jgi:minor extracellular serine protease Vpr
VLRPQISPLLRAIAGSAALVLVLAMPQPAAAQQPDAAGAPGPGTTDEYVIVQFGDPPAATHVDEVPGHQRTRPEPGQRLDPEAAEVRAYVAHLQGHQQEFRDWLAQRHPQAAVVRDFQLIANAVAVERNGVSLRQLRSGPGAVDVQPVGLFRPTMNTSVDLINAPGLWAAVDADSGRADAGAGIDVAVLDTGIDYDHPFFGCKDPDNVVQRLYYSGEVADPALPPPPEAAPENMWSAHGTHVAGTIAGCVAQVQGQTWSGVAPAAAVHDYNVFPALGTGYAAFGGSAFSHDIAAALEDAVADGMHVANMSLGGGQRGPNDFLDEATNASVAAGMTVVISAGNAGPGDATVNSPGSAEDAITVAASTNSQILGVEVVVDGALFTAAIGDFGPAEETTGELADWADAAGGDTLACQPVAAGSFTDDQIVLISRGACTFTTKIRNAENAGAGGVLMYNNVAGPPVAVVHDLTDPEPEIPAVMVSADDAADLLAAVGASATLPSEDTAALVHDPDFANVIAGFSSRGPTPHGDRLKPDVTAPGVNILSTVFESEVFEDDLAFFSGTSMSSPHIAGAAAALLALHPHWGPADVKSAIVNTADPTAVTDHVTGTVDPGVLARGSGLADLGAAAVTPVTLAPANVGFGAWQGNRTVADERQVMIRNVTDDAVTCSLAVSGDIVALSTTEVSLGAGESAGVMVTLDAGNHRVTPSGDYDGSVTVECGDHGSVHAPWWVRIERSAA